MRHRFGLGLRDAGQQITLQEMSRLVMILRNDPSSAITAALEGWDYPISREAMILMDQYDLDTAINSPKGKRPKPYPRPFKNRDVQRKGNTGGRSREEVVAILTAARNGTLAPV